LASSCAAAAQLSRTTPSATHQLPLDALEEGVVADVAEALLQVRLAAQPLGRALQQRPLSPRAPPAPLTYLVEEHLEHAGRLDAERARDPDRLLQDD